jgi:hypothetical protein
MLLTGCGGGSSGGGAHGGSDSQDSSNLGQAGTPSLVPVILPGPIPENSPNPPTGTTYSMSLAIPPRQQWNNNYGYCGEVSFISAGLYFGQYVSQYTARAAATPGVSQDNVNSQLLISINDMTAATTMHLNAVEWSGQSNSATTSQFLTWVKSYVVSGYPVIIGIYVNRGDGSSAGFSEYDH